MGKNYCLIKEQYDKLFVDAIEKKNKSQIKLLKSALNENRHFQKLYTLVENLQTGKVKPERCEQFVNENIKLAKKINLSSFKTIAEALGEGDSTDPMMEHINRVLFENKTISNLEDWEDSYSVICEHLKRTNKAEEISFEEKVKELTPLFEQLDDVDKELITEFTQVPEEEREVVYKKLVEDCVGLLNEQLNKLPKENLSLEQYKHKSEILEAKDRIKESKFDGNCIAKVIKLHTLKKSILS